MSHHALPRVSFHLKTRQEYFFYDEKLFRMLKSGLGGTWYSILFGTPFADFWKGNGPKWGTWPTTAPFRPMFVAMLFFIKM
jgi:hypothetical protein